MSHLAADSGFQKATRAGSSEGQQQQQQQQQTLHKKHLMPVCVCVCVPAHSLYAGWFPVSTRKVLLGLQKAETLEELITREGRQAVGEQPAARPTAAARSAE